MKEKSLKTPSDTPSDEEEEDNKLPLASVEEIDAAENLARPPSRHKKSVRWSKGNIFEPTPAELEPSAFDCLIAAEIEREKIKTLAKTFFCIVSGIVVGYLVYDMVLKKPEKEITGTGVSNPCKGETPALGLNDS